MADWVTLLKQKPPNSVPKSFITYKTTPIFEKLKIKYLRNALTFGDPRFQKHVEEFFKNTENHAKGWGGVPHPSIARI